MLPGHEYALRYRSGGNVRGRCRSIGTGKYRYLGTGAASCGILEIHLHDVLADLGVFEKHSICGSGLRILYGLEKLMV